MGLAKHGANPDLDTAEAAQATSVTINHEECEYERENDSTSLLTSAMR